MYLILILMILEGFHYETLQNEQQIQQETLFKNRVEDAQKERLWCPNARRYSPLMDAQKNALLPSCNCMAE
jgi:hypothetical protein